MLIIMSTSSNILLRYDSCQCKHFLKYYIFSSYLVPKNVNRDLNITGIIIMIATTMNHNCNLGLFAFHLKLNRINVNTTIYLYESHMGSICSMWQA